jgi:L-alanine-DL-glutamate epimerase-like enolase superfamily enzyme
MIRVVSVEVFPVTFRLAEGYRIAGHQFTRAENVFLKMTTSDGRTAFGGAAPFEEVTGEGPDATLLALRDRLGPWLLGEDISDPAAVMRRAAAEVPAAPAARAALDMALLDLQARRAGVPLFRLLGAERQGLPTSVTLGIAGDVEAAVARARRWIEDGFRILKIKVGEDWEFDTRLVRALRSALGPDIVVRADANQGYSEADALRFLRAAEPFGLELLEQPTPASEPEALGRLRGATSVPIMADESVQSEGDAERLVAARSVDLFNIKLMKSGGVLASLGIATRAANAGLGVMFGCNDESRLSIAAALHGALAAPGSVRADLDGHLDLQDDVALGGIRIRDGFIEALDEPGLGVVVDL